MPLSPIDIATQGYLCSPISVATDGYICVDVEFPQTPNGGGFDWEDYYDDDQVRYIPKRTNEDELLLVMKIFTKLCL